MPAVGSGHASSGIGGPASEMSLTDPSAPTECFQTCSLMQWAWQSPQPIRVVTTKVPALDPGWTSYQSAWPIAFGSRGAIPVRRGSPATIRAIAAVGCGDRGRDGCR